MDPARARSLIDQFPARHVLVLGDVILDRYVWGSVERISPEAPVPVVRVDHESEMLGGAGNVARNLASLGAQAEIATTVGADAAADALRRLFQRWKIETAGLVVEADRITTLKTRVIARNQQVVRYDHEVERPIGASTAEGLFEVLRRQAPNVEGVIVQDYGKGLLTADFLEVALEIFARAGVRVFVDPKQGDWHLYGGVELLKPNLREAEQVVGLRVQRGEDLDRLGARLLEHVDVGCVAITRGEAGMSLFARGEEPVHARTRAQPVADVAGAGDTAIAALALARLSGASWLEAADLANAAAGFVVGVPGTSTLTAAELAASLGLPG